MPDYIEREAAIEKIFKAIPYHFSLQTGLERAVNYIREVPAANVRPVEKGRWEDANKSLKSADGHSFNWWCSQCGKPQHTPVAKTLKEFEKENPFCHWCGADMRPETTAENTPTIFTNGQIVDVDLNLYDQEEIHDNCTVQILRNSYTGAVSVGWWENDAAPKGVDYE